MSAQTSLINNIALQSLGLHDNGLYHGKMGVVLALYLFGRAEGNECTCSFAKDLLQASSNDYHDSDIGIEKGAAGFGLGLTLLYKAGMFKDNLNSLLSEVDSKIMSVDPRRITDVSFRSGAVGILHYINERKSTGQEIQSLDASYIHELEDRARHLFSLSGEAIEGRTLMADIKKPEWNEDECQGKEIGIDNGAAYYLIKDAYGKIFLDR